MVAMQPEHGRLLGRIGQCQHHGAADMPGVAPEGIDLRYEQGELILQGKVSPSRRAGHLILGEFEDGDFYRVFQIHESIDSSRIEAECKNGVLTVHLPKAESAKPRQISVKAA